MRSGVILAGGRSTRFGDADKAVADLAGTPMVRRVAERIAPAVDEVIVNCRDDQRAAVADALDGLSRPVSFALDPDPDLGPTAGIAVGLDAAAGEYALVVACDMPFVDPAFVEYLFDRAAGRDAAVPRPDEWFQPTQAVYRTAAMASACERVLDAEDRRVIAALSDLDSVVVDRAEIERHASMETFENLNTREEFDAAHDRF
ncbi:molybdenum cofactor guanylyltransferase [Halorussus salilacus]|uniref:molybdenum cofactor guanylyltransferase n=1 Tax=Halorussus salilacus TaxID=2953750 RepID=UPI00209E6DC2|nr:molybdenum cofactor guanylyltransferase [Halorussus salilacus]USZ66917.1 molybdenum cofactor guanylyltransferase [Halorussus salilacus]